MGFIIYGNDDSPVVPLMLYMPAKIGYVPLLLLLLLLETAMVTAQCQQTDVLLERPHSKWKDCD